MILVKLFLDHQETADKFDTPEAREVFPELVKHASLALRAGVRMNLAEYRSLTVIERLAFARAGDELERQSAQRVGMASSSLMGAALVTQDVDDGEAAEELAVDMVHAAALADAESG